MNRIPEPDGAASLGWPPLPPLATLPVNEVQVLWASLDVTPERLASLREHLCPDELARAARFRFPAGQQQFAAARGLLREILGRYLGVPPGKLTFAYGPTGKPELDGTQRALHFNLAHCGSDAVFACSSDGPVGIDLERIRPLPDLAQLARSVFSPREQSQWESLPAAEQPQAFFECWTRKEAYLKGTALGLGRTLGELDVPLERRQHDDAFAIRDRGEPVADWWLRSLSEADYAVTLALQNSDARTRCWSWR